MMSSIVLFITVESVLPWMLASVFHYSRSLIMMLVDLFNPLTPTVAIWVQHPVPDRAKPSSVRFDIWAL